MNIFRTRTKKKAHNNKVVYTCVTGGYDVLQKCSYIDPEWDYICFTDNTTSNNNGWTLKPLRFSRLDNSRNNRWHKINPHKILNEYDHSIYIDANIDIVSDAFFKLIEKEITNSKLIALPKHPKRDSIYDELKACLAQKKDDPEIMIKEVDRIKKEGFPDHFGLYANGVIYREHNNRKVKKMMNEWWTMVRKYSKRDQLSLAYIFWKNNFTPEFLNVKVYDDNSKLIRFREHS